MEDLLQLYLPIAEMRINVLLLIAVGLFVGTLAGMLGLGGGLISVPLLTALQVPPSIAVATATNQMTAASFSGYLAYSRRGRVDYKLGALLILGGLFGSYCGILIFNALTEIGKIDTFISLSFSLLLTSTAFFTLKDIITISYYRFKNLPRPRPTPSILRQISLPIHMHFIGAKREISIFSPIIIGFIGGIMVATMGIGGSLIMIPAMLYILRISEEFTAGTSHLQIIFTTIISTIMHSMTSHNLDIVLSTVLIIGTVVGAQLGARMVRHFSQDKLRLLFAIIILVLCINAAYQLVAEPSCIYDFEVMNK